MKSAKSLSFADLHFASLFFFRDGSRAFRRSPRPIRHRFAIGGKREMNDSALSFRSTGALLKETASEWLEDNALRLSAALAYYSTFSIAPLIVIALAIAGWVFGREAASGMLDQQLYSLLGGAAAEGVKGMLQSASKPSSSAMAGVLGILALFLGASGVFGQLKDALNTIWEVRQKKGSTVKRFFRERLLSFGMVLVVGFLLLVSLLLTAGVSGLSGYFGSSLPAPLLTALSSIVSFGVITALFAAIFKVLPDVKIQWRDVWIGALVTALLFEIGKFLLALYLGRQSTSSAYGAATAVVLVLLWVYYASLILFFGAEFTQVYAKARGVRIEPTENAEPVTDEARAQQGLGNKEAEAAIPAPPKESLHEALGIHEPESSASEFLERNAIYLLIAGLLGGVVAGSGLRALERERLSPVGEIKHGTRELAVGAATGAAVAFAKLLKFLRRQHLRKAADKAFRQVRRTIGNGVTAFR
jgi:membrane protein